MEFRFRDIRGLGSCRAILTRVLVVGSMAMSAHAMNMIVNGGFETVTNGLGQFDDLTQATGWTSTATGYQAYNFIFGPGTADTSGVNGQYGNLKLWGPNDGANNGLPATSPDGGNFVAADGAFQVGGISQTLSGLTVGHQYGVSFYWAGVQQQGFSGPTTEQWRIFLGTEEHDTSIVSEPTHGFSGWHYASATFTATATSEALTFLAAGTPNGEPPFTLLDGVVMTPEPGTAGMLVGGLLCGLGLVRFRRTKRNG